MGCPRRVRAQTWAKSQRALLTGAYKQPEAWETDFEFVPRIKGEIGGTAAASNVKIHRVNFTFSEILPNAPAPV